MSENDGRVSVATVALDRWKRGIDGGDLELIASAFTTEALFQGLRPVPAFGLEGVKAYYASQPSPLTVDYDVTHVRELGTAVVVYLTATFHPAGNPDLHTHITLVLEPIDSEWLINHYHVSLIA